MNKRAIAILGAIFILIVGTLGFLIFQRSRTDTDQLPPPIVDDQPTTPEEPAEPPEEVEPEPTGRATRLSDEAVVSPILFYQGNGISYFNNQGQLFQTDLQISGTGVLLSNKRELTIPNKPSISRVLWPEAGNSFIAEFGSTKKTWSFYDSTKADYVDLPGQIYSLDWMPSGDKIVYVWVQDGKSNLSMANPDATGFRKLTDFHANDNIIDVSPDGKNILFYRNQDLDRVKNAINLVTTEGGMFRSMVTDGYNRGTLWSGDSKKFLFTKRDPSTQKFSLWVGDIVTGQMRTLGFTTTEQKAIWAKDDQNIYVAVPTTGTAGQGLTEDTLYRLNVNTLEKSELLPGVAVDVQDMFLSSSESVLFFRNAQDNSLYYMNL